MRVPKYRRKAGTDDPAADFAEQVSKTPLPWGEIVTVTLDGTGAAQLFRHGLGRRFRGCIVAGLSVTTVVVVPGSPVAVEAAGEDAAVYGLIDPTSSTVATVTLWVF